MRGFAVAVVAVALMASAQTALAQSWTANPFMSAGEILASRGGAPAATLRLRYQMDAQGGGANASDLAELVLEIADDWVLVRSGERATLRDFRIGRNFELITQSGAFVSMSQMADVAFRVAELQNRSVLARVINAAAPNANNADACDAETELGVSIPALGDRADVTLRAVGGITSAHCNNRDVGLWQVSETAAPRALWPALSAEMAVHPALLARVRESRRAPQRVEARYRMGPNAQISRAWRLIATESVNTPYPLVDNSVNETAQTIDASTFAGLGHVAREAVAGLSDNGVITLEQWNARLRTLNALDPTAAALAMMPLSGMFPEVIQSCSAGRRDAICEVMRGMRARLSADAAVRGAFAIATGEQSGDLESALRAMQETQATSHRDHPAISAAFALALVRGGSDLQTRARTLGLPTDIDALQLRAVQAFPYNGLYWTDIADRYAASYRFREAYMLYDVVFALPMGGVDSLTPARRGPHPIPQLEARAQLNTRLRSDFPQFFLGL